MAEHIQLSIALCRIAFYTDTPWTECLPIAGYTHYGQFRDANQPTTQSLDRGRKPEYPEETPEARGEHANSTHTAEVGVEPPTLEGNQNQNQKSFYCQCFRKLCCRGPPSPRPEYDVVCIGLSGAGKTSLISRLCSEGLDGIVPTADLNISLVFNQPPQHHAKDHCFT
ncbi:hypothetical protein QTP86_015926 [Hemibagrus guttatus]|nr:hypothetical protein QTP86_015926 [Hemibagrus guttatus]